MSRAAMSTSSKPTDIKSEEFRKLVERSGIVEIVTKALVDLYVEPFQEPEDALAFFRNRLNLSSDKELEAAKAKIQELEAKVSILQLEGSSS